MKYSLVFSFIFYSSCSLFQTNDEKKESENPVYIYNIPTSKTKAIDILFIIDNSLSLGHEQELFKSQFLALIHSLIETYGTLPDLHIGVTSTDLGTSPYDVPGCETPNGDNGKLLKGTCANPTTNNYIVDVEPAGCNIERSDSNNEFLCTNSDCTQANCQIEAFMVDGVASEPSGLIFVEKDENNCPRCRNYTNEDIAQVFQCIAALGISGCGFEQPLEAMYKTFTEFHTENIGFFRENSYLSILFLTDEDDCSASESEIFNPDGDINSSLGARTSFRCTEFGIKCDEEWDRNIPTGNTTYTNCTSRQSGDPDSMLYPVSKYVNYLLQIRYRETIFPAAIAGPFDGNLSVGVDENQNPRLGFSCGMAVPTIRIKEFVKAFTPDPDDMEWAYTSICLNDYSPAFLGLGEKLSSVLGESCTTAPLIGCPDPSFANGFEKITNLPDSEAVLCVPECSIVETISDGPEEEIEQCPFSYLNGHPPAIDPQLPLDKCFHISFTRKCAKYDNFGPSRGATIVISRQHPPEPLTRVTATCESFLLTEQNCSNNIDDDFDGDIDLNDIDCLDL
jgi:hypothetical protein